MADQPASRHWNQRSAGHSSPPAGVAGLDAKGRLEVLRWMLDRSDALVRYAEAKNGLLTALAGGSVAAIMRVTIGGGWLTGLARDGATLLLGLTIIVCLVSFLPGLGARIIASLPRRKSGGVHETANPMYFVHAAGMEPKPFARAMAATIGLDAAELSRAERAVLEQVRQTAVVARGKFALFSLGVWLFLAATLCLLTALLTRA